MKKYTLAIAIMTGLLASTISWPLSGAATPLPHVTPTLQNPEFWIKKISEPDQMVLTPEQIEDFNHQIIIASNNILYDLADYPAQVSREQIIKLVSQYAPPSANKFVNGHTLPPNYSNQLKKQLNLTNINPQREVEYAYTVQRADLRAFPTDDIISAQADNLTTDLMQETALKPGQALIVLHYNQDQQWALVQSFNYAGWVKTDYLAITNDRSLWLSYLKPDQFLIITAARIEKVFSPNGTELILTMGTKLPLAQSPFTTIAAGKYLVKIPARNPAGQLEFASISLPASSELNWGYLPYTRANLIKQAFKLQGQIYGWGGMFNSWDCSSLVADVYQCCGIYLPRNSSEQEILPVKKIDLRPLNPSERADAIADLSPGAALYLPGHTMLYLGQHEQQAYVISATGSIRQNTDNRGNWKVQPIDRVIVSDLSLLRKSNGVSWLNSLDWGLDFESLN